jgi:hypothetical protein
MKGQIPNTVSWLVILAMLLSACASESTSDSNLATAVASAISATQTVEAEIQARVEATVSAQQKVIPTEAVDMHDVIAIVTGDPKFGAVSIHKNGEMLAVMTETDVEGKIREVRGVVWRSSDGLAVTLYLGDNGLPSRAMAEGSLITLDNYTDRTVDITVIGLDGTTHLERGVPIDVERLRRLQIGLLPLRRTPGLASIVAQEKVMTTEEAMQMAAIAFGVFSCAATFASGGTLSVVFGLGCASTLISIWSALQPDTYAVVEGMGSGGSAIACGVGLGERNPTAIGDCAALILDTSADIVALAQDTEQRIVSTVPPTAGMIAEEFDNPSMFSQVSNNIWVSDGKAQWSVSRSGGEQYIYRSIPPFSGDVRLTVKGQIDSWTNNCGISAGIGDGYRSGVATSFGFYGGGCATHGAVVTASGVKLDYQERSCSFSGNWLWIQPKTLYEATLTIENGMATLGVPGVGIATGELTYLGEYNTLYVGMYGGGDWPECLGSIESMVIEPLQ